MDNDDQTNDENKSSLAITWMVSEAEHIALRQIQVLWMVVIDLNQYNNN